MSSRLASRAVPSIVAPKHSPLGIFRISPSIFPSSIFGRSIGTTTGGLIPTSTLRPSLAISSFTSPSPTTRSVHSLERLTSRPAPPTTPFVPNVETFLKLIGRGMLSHASRIPSWEALFKMSSSQLQSAGVEPARQRRYLLWWRERFRRGDFGVGGDFQFVSPDGVAELRVYEQPFPLEWIELARVKRERQIAELESRLEALGDQAPEQSEKFRNQISVFKANPATHARTPNTRLIAVNVPSGSATQEICPVAMESVQPLRFIKIRGAHSIAGPFVMPLKGTDGRGASVTVQDGLWEEKRGRKIDGGERRRAEVQAKRRIAEHHA